MTTGLYHPSNRNCQQSDTPSFPALVAKLPAQLQFRAFPVHPGTKTPAVKRWERHRRTVEGRHRLLQGYQLRFPGHAMGLRLGEGVDGPLAVIDVDVPENLTEWQLDQLEAWTWLVATARGFHVYGRPPEWALATIKRHPWGDYLANAAYVIGPGNLHPSGTTYRPLPEFGIGDVPTLPEGLLQELLAPQAELGNRSHPKLRAEPKRKQGKKHPSHGVKVAPPGAPSQAPLGATGGRLGKPDTPRRIFDRLAELLYSARPGERNSTLFDAVRLWAYRQPQPEDLQQWIRQVQEQAITWGYRIPNKRGFSDGEMLAIGKTIAVWTHGRHFRRPEALDSTTQRYRQLLGREKVRAKNHARNAAILGLHAEGLSIRQIAAHVGLGRSAVADVIKRGAQIAATPEELARALQQ